MGAWGTSLYANDSACDIRDDYLDKLKRGKTNEEATEELIDANGSAGDAEEDALFWFALADTQWNYGRLLQEVKEKALFYLTDGQESTRWEDAGQKQQRAWEKTLSTLKQKLESPQPPLKRVSQYRIYRCKWNMGDVFAYRFTSDYSREKGFYDKYVIFRKVSEDTWWPGHIIPVVQFYKWTGEDIPCIDKLSDFDLLPASYSPLAEKKTPNNTIEYKVKLVTDLEKAIPKSNLTFLGNLPGNDIIPFRGHEYCTDYQLVGWESSKYNTKFEHYVIDVYLAWNSIAL